MRTALTLAKARNRQGTLHRTEQGKGAAGAGTTEERGKAEQFGHRGGAHQTGQTVHARAKVDPRLPPGRVKPRAKPGMMEGKPYKSRRSTRGALVQKKGTLAYGWDTAEFRRRVRA